MLFRFAQGLTDALLFREVAIELFNVLARLLGLRGSALDVLHVSPVREVNDGNNGYRGGERKESDVADESRDYACGERACEVCDRGPEKIRVPGVPHGLLSG